tara:strand:- start:123 stop:674 length:552 start_codon:yes stop_codon:yes gene_type:complete
MNAKTNKTAAASTQTVKEAISNLDANGSTLTPELTPFEKLKAATNTISAANGGSMNYANIAKAPIKICEDNMATIPQFLQLIAGKKNVVLSAQAIINRMEDGEVSLTAVEAQHIDSTEIFEGNSANRSKDNNRFGWSFKWLVGEAAWGSQGDKLSDHPLAIAFLQQHGVDHGNGTYTYKVFTR